MSECLFVVGSMAPLPSIGKMFCFATHFENANEMYGTCAVEFVEPKYRWGNRNWKLLLPPKITHSLDL